MNISNVNLTPEVAEWLSGLDSKRHIVIVARTKKSIEDKVGEWTNDTDPVLVEEAWIEVVAFMYLCDLRDEWVDEGFVEITGVDDDGHYMLEVTDLGMKEGGF